MLHLHIVIYKSLKNLKTLKTLDLQIYIKTHSNQYIFQDFEVKKKNLQYKHFGFFINFKSRLIQIKIRAFKTNICVTYAKYPLHKCSYNKFKIKKMRKMSLKLHRMYLKDSNIPVETISFYSNHLRAVFVETI